MSSVYIDPTEYRYLRISISDEHLLHILKQFPRIRRPTKICSPTSLKLPIGTFIPLFSTTSYYFKSISAIDSQRETVSLQR
jgi:hypothetical protein